MSIQDFQKKNPTFVIRVIFTINIFWVVLPKIISKFLGILCPMQSLSVISNSSTRLRQAPRKILRVVEQEISPKGRNDNEGVEMTAGKPEFSINDIGNDRFFSNWGQAWVLSFIRIYPPHPQFKNLICFLSVFPPRARRSRGAEFDPSRALFESFDKAQDRLRDLRSRLIRCRGGVHLKGDAHGQEWFWVLLSKQKSVSWANAEGTSSRGDETLHIQTLF